MSVSVTRCRGGGVCVHGEGKVRGTECDRVCVTHVHECDVCVHATRCVRVTQGACACDTCVTRGVCVPVALAHLCCRASRPGGECGWVCHGGVVGACDTAHVCA